MEKLTKEQMFAKHFDGTHYSDITDTMIMNAMQQYSDQQNAELQDKLRVAVEALENIDSLEYSGIAGVIANETINKLKDK